MASLPAPPHAAVLELGQRRLVPLVVHGLVAHDELLRGEKFLDIRGIPFYQGQGEGDLFSMQ